MTDLTQPLSPDDDRIVGWKSIAASLHVAQRTAIRWSETYGLPIHRTARGSRPFVFAIRAELEAWPRSADAAQARSTKCEPADGADGRGEDSPPPAAVGTSCPASDSHAEPLVVAPVSPTVPSGAGKWRRPGGWPGKWRVAIAGVVAVLAGVVAAWRLPGAPADPTLAWKLADGARGEALSPDQVTLEVVVAGQRPATIVTRPGDLVRIETPSLRLALQTRHEGPRLRLVAHRLETLANGEAASYLFTRHLTAGRGERLTIEAQDLDVTWVSTTAPGDGDPRVPLEPCCLTCKNVTLCGQTVGSACGHCEGKAKPGL